MLKLIKRIPLTGWATLAALLSLSQPSLGQGESIESDWIELVKGYKGKAVGIELVDMKGGGDAEHEVTLAIPKEALNDPDTIEEVVVVGQAPEKPEPIDVTFEWVDDHDEDNYGLVIRFGRMSNWPIRLYMNSEPGFRR